MQIKLILENSAGNIAESEPFLVDDETDVQIEVLDMLEERMWALHPGDTIRIVEVK